jgi:hypothetical protein
MAKYAKGSPADEFRRLVSIYLDTHAETTKDGKSEQANLGRFSFTRNDGVIDALYLRPCAMHYELVWSDDHGFHCEDWYVLYELLQRTLILERLADV